jgi:hypothetical protein
MMGTIISTALVLILSSMAWAQDSRPSRTRKADWPEGAPGKAVMPVKMLPITEAPYSRPHAMKHRVSDDDLVIGLAHDGVARAYPILMLGGPSREIINDRFGDQPYVVNW